MNSNIATGLRSVVAGCLVAAWLTTGAVLSTHAQTHLPDESQLPGQAGPDQPKPLDPSGLPSESDLPGQADPSQLPGEDRLPPESSADQRADGGGEPGNNELAPIAGSAPLLRLSFDGHTGVIRSMDLSDGGRTLITAGEDKEVHVWRRSDIGSSGWMHRRTIRWPVTRGPRGLIYAATLKGDQLAFAGYGASGGAGEIRVVDVASGDLQRTLFDDQTGHRSNVVSVGWAPGDAVRLVSTDVEGKLILWQPDTTTGFWLPKVLVAADSQTYSGPVAAALAAADRRAFVPTTFVGNDYVVVPRYTGPGENGYAGWQLQRVNMVTGASDLLTNLVHLKHVRSMSATDDGRRLASCDWAGTIGVWTFRDGSIASFESFRPDAAPNFVQLSDSGDQLFFGTDAVGDEGAQLQTWDISKGKPTLVSSRRVDGLVRAGVIDESRREVLVSQGNEVHWFSYDTGGALDDSPPKRLKTPVDVVRRVAFAKDGDSYQIAMGHSKGGEFDDVFDLSESKLRGGADIDADAFVPAQRLPNMWRIGDPEKEPFQFFESDQARGTLPLVQHLNGSPTAIATMPGLVIVGTDRNNNIYAYRADDADPPVLVRQMRDHNGAVTSLGTSSDGKYLVSAAEDATVSLWNLQDIDTATPMVNRWGCEFELESDALIASGVREDGPLYFRGVRGGDELVSIGWVNHDGELFAESDVAAMRDRLLDLPFDVMVELKFKRLRSAGPHFNSLPAWRPIATLFVDQNREWAWWTPAGYYDASFNGHQNFGWQLNRGRDNEVEYFRAAQFRKQLERPDIMRRLLAAGSLPEAMRQTVSQIGPAAGQGAIVNQYESKPTIRLLKPAAGEKIVGDELVVEASIDVPLGASLVKPKAFVSGVPAISCELVQTPMIAAGSTSAAEAANAAGNPAESADTDQSNAAIYRWKFRLPQDRQLQLEILAATEAESVDRVLVEFDHQPSDVSRAKPRLHVLAIGVGSYRDPQIQSLDFAAGAAGTVVNLFREKSALLYQTSADQLVDTDATRPLWRVFARDAADRLRPVVSPDDLVIMYLCGHGLRDRRTNQWYFVTADARYNDLMNDRYDDCIAFSDLASLAQLPCRKLAILDSCHSGAVQPLMRTDDLKSALRFLQDDVVLTLTASEGDEEAAEQRESRMGRFTATMVDALGGKADQMDESSINREPANGAARAAQSVDSLGRDSTGNGDGVISITELVDYVSRRVSRESEAEGMPQHPTASPGYLLRTLTLPLTTR
ncbi:WD domain, G-beta repeat [Rubripirellula lacrimiformis]|uniref:WD domain, G-beta repeat n=1 Tax=Rubripirellula lacrimiformis TaxID=1930273 RepID=A0A517NBJ6_9BACT|nr:caspase family protein [Rubripirellula lacrimiformis]QDT04502.1 WD domain, G-beta repeat [Rubripirellula lacrimiformis]